MQMMAVTHNKMSTLDELIKNHTSFTSCFPECLIIDFTFSHSFVPFKTGLKSTQKSVLNSQMQKNSVLPVWRGRFAKELSVWCPGVQVYEIYLFKKCIYLM